MSVGVYRVGWWIGRGLLAALFLLGGIGHFAAPAVYLKIMPPSLPAPLTLVYLSGVAEFVLGGLLLFRATQQVAAWGLIAVLIAIWPANLFMWQHAELFPTIPPLALLIRLPLQGVLIAWAWVYTRPRREEGAPGAIRPQILAACWLALPLTLTLSGCGIGTPSLPRLDRGSLVKAMNVDGKPVIVFFAASEETVAPGTIMKVVSDDEGTTKQVNRKVIVGFQDGPHQGLAALVRRSDLQLDQ